MILLLSILNFISYIGYIVTKYAVYDQSIYIDQLLLNNTDKSIKLPHWSNYLYYIIEFILLISLMFQFILRIKFKEYINDKKFYFLIMISFNIINIIFNIFNFFYLFLLTYFIQIILLFIIQYKCNYFHPNKSASELIICHIPLGLFISWNIYLFIYNLLIIINYNIPINHNHNLMIIILTITYIIYTLHLFIKSDIISYIIYIYILISLSINNNNNYYNLNMLINLLVVVIITIICYSIKQYITYCQYCKKKNEYIELEV